MNEAGQTARSIRVGCAGWNVPKQFAGRFAPEGSHLVRYASRLNCVEINSTFYRNHQPKTFARWANEVPDDFRFSVKLPKAITHEKCLQDVDDDLQRFVDEVSVLGTKLGPVLIQLPPKQAFDQYIVSEFLTSFRRSVRGHAVIEPRHASWFTDAVNRTLVEMKVGRVAADPAVVSSAAEPGGWPEVVYYRLHGSPDVYWSNYTAEKLDELSSCLCDETKAAETYCIFDNTAAGWAADNALTVLMKTASAIKRPLSYAIT